MARQGSKGMAMCAKKSYTKTERSSSKQSLRGSSLDDEDPTAGLLAGLTGPPEKRSEAQLLDTLRWWLKHLPASGAELAAELRAPDHVLLEVFRRGRIFAFERGKRLQDVDDEVRSYTIILLGRCKLRCGKPAPTRVRTSWGTDAQGFDSTEPTEEDLVAEGALDSDGLVPLGEVNRGESLGMFPGDKSACYEVTCLEKTTVLQISREDYEVVLKPFQREVHVQALDFIQRHRICPQATISNLEWLVRHLTQRTVLKGKTIMKAGDPHRNLWFLREGSCSVLLDADAACDVLAVNEELNEEAQEEKSEGEAEEEDPIRLAKMKVNSKGAALQNRAAAAEQRNKFIAKYARGPMLNLLEGSRRPSPDLGMGGRSSAILSEPGVMLGEEVLLFNPQDLVAAKCSYTIKAEQDCSFYVADLTTWRQLANFVGPDGIAHFVHEQLQRRCKMIARTKVVSTRLDRRKRNIVRTELHKDDRQKLRMPSCPGDDAPRELEDTDNYLQLVFEHRRGPENPKNLPSLCALEGTKLGPGCPGNGPAVNKMLQVVSQNPAGPTCSGKKYCEHLRRVRMAPKRRVNTGHSANPMGEFVPAEAATHYEAEAHEFLRRCSSAPSQAALTMGDLSRISSQPSPSGIGIFMHTELDTPEVTLMQSSSVPLLPKVPRSLATDENGQETADGGLVPEDFTMQPLTPLLETALRPGTSGSAGPSRVVPPPLALAAIRPGTSGSGRSKEAGFAGAAAKEAPARSQRKPRSAAAERQTKVMKAFTRACAKKSVLVLTDKADVKKTITNCLLVAGVDLCFAKSSTGTWQRLQDPKESFHALIWDLTKSEVSVDELLKNIRAHDRYSRLPVIVLAADRELPETVRVACSFVVFHPVAASMLREALLWCFDRGTLTKMVAANQEATVTSSLFDEFSALRGSTVDAWGPQEKSSRELRVA